MQNCALPLVWKVQSAKNGDEFGNVLQTLGSHDAGVGVAGSKNAVRKRRRKYPENTKGQFLEILGDKIDVIFRGPPAELAPVVFGEGGLSSVSSMKIEYKLDVDLAELKDYRNLAPVRSSAAAIRESRIPAPERDVFETSPRADAA